MADEGAGEIPEGCRIYFLAGPWAPVGEGLLKSCVDGGCLGVLRNGNGIGRPEGREREGTELRRDEPDGFGSGAHAGVGGAFVCRAGWFVLRCAGQREGEMAEAAEEGAEVASGGEVGDRLVILTDEAFEDAEDFGRDFGGVEPGGGLAEAAPAGEPRVLLAFGQRRRPGELRPERVMAAEALIAEGGAAARLAGGHDVAAFEGVHWDLRTKGKAARIDRAASAVFLSIFRISIGGPATANFVGCGGLWNHEEHLAIIYLTHWKGKRRMIPNERHLKVMALNGGYCHAECSGMDYAAQE